MFALCFSPLDGLLPLLKDRSWWSVFHSTWRFLLFCYVYRCLFSSIVTTVCCIHRYSNFLLWFFEFRASFHLAAARCIVVSYKNNLENGEKFKAIMSSRWIWPDMTVTKTSLIHSRRHGKASCYCRRKGVSSCELFWLRSLILTTPPPWSWRPLLVLCSLRLWFIWCGICYLYNTCFHWALVDASVLYVKSSGGAAWCSSNFWGIASRIFLLILSLKRPWSIFSIQKVTSGSVFVQSLRT